LTSNPPTPRDRDSGNCGQQILLCSPGDFQNDQLEPLAQYYRKKYNLGITILPAVPIDPSTRDTSRRQLMAENIVSGLRSQVPKYAYDQKAILIAFTSEDIYPTSRDWQFAFGWRRQENRAAVVSTARLRIENGGSAEVSATRLRKIVTKDIGILYCGMAQNQDPHSVLYSQIMGMEELDEVGEDF
jgi:predicted Zn-dependent protease